MGRKVRNWQPRLASQLIKRVCVCACTSGADGVGFNAPYARLRKKELAMRCWGPCPGAENRERGGGATINPCCVLSNSTRAALARAEKGSPPRWQRAECRQLGAVACCRMARRSWRTG